jgi:27-O-demethylrifamycin SV methyltransferase
MKYFDIGRHYDSVTEGWRHIFGDDFHFGYFRTPQDSLDTATDNLIDELAALGRFGPDKKILDAGCGIGGPAFYLHDKFGSPITGISISKKGIDLASEGLRSGKYQGKVGFMVADMTATGFPDESFDIAWVMESSHLIQNKKLLFDECYRLLKPGGEILLCDVLVSDKFDFIFKVKNVFELINIVKTYGRGRAETPQCYTQLMRQAGFKNIISRDISKEAAPTLERWGKNIAETRSDLIKVFDATQIRRFEKSIETLKYCFREGYNLYYVFRAEK